MGAEGPREFGLDLLFARVAGRFGRVEPRRQARAYLTGLLAPLERKNGWQLAEAAGHATPGRMQRLLSNARWDPRAVRDDLRAYVMDNLGHRDGVLIVDETCFVKKGAMSAGVQRQYSRTARRTENCQLGIFLAYASPLGRALIDAELYLPQSWLADRPRCTRAGIPDGARFQTKPVLARAMLTRALDAGVPASWVTADETYGQGDEFRHSLEQRRVSYVVAVPKSQTVAAGVDAQTLAVQVPRGAWKRLPAGDGSQETRSYDWALATIHAEGEPGYRRRLLIRRGPSLQAGGEPELTFYLCHNPAGTVIDDLAHVAGTHRAIGECFRSARDETGLDHYQVRRYDAWHRHVTLAMLAHAYLAVTAAAPARSAVVPSASPGPKAVVSWHT
ncbi:IS701 family transposase [Microbispora siamensis]